MSAEKIHNFSFTPDLGVTSQSGIAEAAYIGIDETIRIAGLTPKIDQSSLDHSAQLSEICTFFQMSNGQIDADKLYGTLVSNNFSSAESPAYLLISGDLKASGTNFIFGFSVKEEGLSVQSIARFKQSNRDITRPVVTRHIARHEYGHLLGLDNETIVNQDKRGGLYKGHCLNVCTMQQVMSVPEANNQAAQLEHKSHAGFCMDCVGTLRKLHP